MAAGSYIIWLFGGYTVLHGGMTLGTLTAFAAYLIQFYQPFQNFSRAPSAPRMDRPLARRPQERLRFRSHQWLRFRSHQFRFPRC